MFPEADRLHRGEPFAPVPKAHLGHGSSDSDIPPFDQGGDKKPLTSQELTLNYLRDNPHRVQTGAVDTEEHLPSARNILDALGISSRLAKGKEVASGEPLHGDRQSIEKDFLQLGGGGPPSKRGALGGDNEGADDRGKRAKIETLCPSLGLPNLQLSLISSIPTAVVTQATTIGTAIAQLVAPTATTEPPSAAPSKRTRSANTYTTRTSSDDFTASRTYSYYSNPFSHNPSCSLTRNSTDNYAFGRDNDQIWCAGEGTNGSVHSRFKPIGDTIGNKDSLSNHHGCARQSYIVKEAIHSPYIAYSSDNCSFFPSDVPANQRENAVAVSEGHKHEGLSRPDRVLRAIVSESVSIGAQMLQDASSNSVEGIKDYLRNLITAPDKIEFSSLQRRLERRSDLTHDTLLRAHGAQLDILVSIKTGLANFLSGKNHLPTAELVEIFLLSRCKNVNCRSLLPVDDCDCKICSTKMGFCSACMCPICLGFDCASNTCSWVGCDVCSHWCHAACGIQQNLIRSGRRLEGDVGTTETQFYCLGCGHAFEMFGFVKEVFMCCARDWGIETLIKELDCVKKIFRVSEDTRGKELHDKAEEMLSMLDKKLISPIDACNNMVQFLKYGVSEMSTSARTSKDKGIPKWCQKDEVNALSLAPFTPSETCGLLNSSGLGRNTSKDVQKVDRAAEPEPSFMIPRRDDFDSVESIVRFKEAEAKLFERLAGDARREVEGYRQMARAKADKLEEEYETKLANLCLQETQERRGKIRDELKILESSHYDYYNLKMRMQTEIASLLERVEATKQLWV